MLTMMEKTSVMKCHALIQVHPSILSVFLSNVLNNCPVSVSWVCFPPFAVLVSVRNSSTSWLGSTVFTEPLLYIFLITKRCPRITSSIESTHCYWHTSSLTVVPLSVVCHVSFIPCAPVMDGSLMPMKTAWRPFMECRMYGRSVLIVIHD